MMACMLGICLALWLVDIMPAACTIHCFVIFMILVWAVTDFCPSLFILKFIFPSLYANGSSKCSIENFNCK
eukprot:UN05328